MTSTDIEAPPNVKRRSKHYSYVAAVCILLGIGLRVLSMFSSTLWVDEAESSINALTILDRGIPTSTYQGQPIFENTLIKEAPGDPEYEFYDISYSDKGVAIYHGWLPLYAIAAAQAIGGIRPDPIPTTSQTLHDVDDVVYRTVIPRIPSVLFSAVFLIGTYLLLRKAANEQAALIVLVFICFNKFVIRYGVDARYYSSVLCMTMLCAAAAWSLHKNGRWRDYVYLGVAEALLFHTHQLSALIFAITCVTLAPSILKHEHWLRKAALAASIAGLLTIPWAYFAGFFSSAVELPKAHELFTSNLDWIDYVLDRHKPLIVILCMAGLLVLCVILDHFSIKRIKGLSKRLNIYVFLAAWSLIAYISFQLLVPAASYFYERLTLIVYVPVIIFISMAISETLKLIPRTLHLPLSLIIPFSLLVFLKDTPNLHANINDDIDRISSVFRLINENSADDETRIYASPNSHLVWAYYTGLPVQSIAPIRRSFLENYTGRLIYIENSYMMTVPQVEYTPPNTYIDVEEKDLYDYLLMQHMIGTRLEERGISQWREKIAPLPTHLESAFEKYMASEIHAWEVYHASVDYLSIFKGLDVNNVKDLWMIFFYRFVDYSSRIGDKMNIHPLLLESEIIILPEGNIAVFIYENL